MINEEMTWPRFGYKKSWHDTKHKVDIRFSDDPEEDWVLFNTMHEAKEAYIKYLGGK